MKETEEHLCSTYRIRTLCDVTVFKCTHCRQDRCTSHLMSPQLRRRSDHLLLGLLASPQSSQWRLQADYNDVKVKHGGGTRRLSHTETPRRAGVKCHTLSESSAAGIWEITDTLASPLLSFYFNFPPFRILSFLSLLFAIFPLPPLL